MNFATLVSLAVAISVAAAQSCVVNSVASAASLSSCTSVTIEAFTVPSGSELLRFQSESEY